MTMGEKRRRRRRLRAIAYAGVAAAWALTVWVSTLLAPPEWMRMPVLFLHLAALVVGLGAVLMIEWHGLLWATGWSTAREVRQGRHHEHFVVDMIQGGAGTSSNMNANEVIANRALELLGLPRGNYAVISPNTHVNLSQSTNDVFPTATRLAILSMQKDLLSRARALAAGLRAKSHEFADVLKVGRTHLQDAVPITLGQEFGGYADNVNAAADGVEHAAEALYELNLGATAVGTGLS